MRALLHVDGTRVLAAALAVTSIAGCGETETSAPLSERVRQIGTDLSLGSNGAGVRTLHDYLTTYGYFPNPALARQYGAWRPLVAVPPADDATFDEHTDEAVRRLQVNLGLAATGVVDDSLRALMSERFCGVPDGILPAGHGDGEKFALDGGKWSKLILTWGFTNSPVPGGPVPSWATNAAIEAINGWRDQTNLGFNQAAPGTTPDIKLTFGFIDGPGGAALASTKLPNEGGDITIETVEPWATGTPDLRAVLLHEFGHALGLVHSSIGTATMYPKLHGTTRTLKADDMVAVSALYDSYSPLPGAALDVGTNGNAGRSALWVIGTDNVVYAWNGLDTWIADDGLGVRITVEPNGNPWVIGLDGAVYRRGSPSVSKKGTWSLVAGAGTAFDIGAGGTSIDDTHVWIIGTNPRGEGFQVYKYRSGSQFDANTGGAGGAVRIAVSSAGQPWVVTNTGKIYRLNSNVASATNWEQLPGVSKDIAVGPGNYAWSIAPLNAQLNLAPWDEQAKGFEGGPIPPARKGWVQGKTIGVGPSGSLAVGRRGEPYVTDSFNTIWSSSR